MRLEPKILILATPCQTGFIKERNSFNYIRRLLNIIQLATDNEVQGLVASLDSFKAFDRIDWPFLFIFLKGLIASRHLINHKK